jgi:predicted nucleic acid-binding protein
LIYLDANFFIFANFDQTTRGENARRLQEKIVSGMKATTSALALDEVMWVLLRNGRKDVLREVIEDIYAMPNFSILDVSSSVPLDALSITEKFDLRPRDAFHVAVMRSREITQIVSDDSDYDRVKGITRIGL